MDGLEAPLYSISEIMLWEKKTPLTDFSNEQLSHLDRGPTNFCFDLASLQRLLEVSRLDFVGVELINDFRVKIGRVGNQKPGANNDENGKSGPYKSGSNSQITCVNIVHIPKRKLIVSIVVQE